MDTKNVDLSREEINIIRNGMYLILAKDKSEHDLSDSAREHYARVRIKFDEIAKEWQ